MFEISATFEQIYGENADFYHLAMVAAEIARISHKAEMDFDVLSTIVAEEERRSG